MMTNNEFIQYCREQHDVVCNQKYNNKHPYSFHLELVATVGNEFDYLLSYEDQMLAILGSYGHDLIEDARVTYNDIVTLKGEIVAEIIYSCTEEKGRNRSERHNDVYFNHLAQNRIGTFVKLCDIIANVRYSLLTNSSMYKKYKSEFPKIKQKLGHFNEFMPLFDHLEKLLALK